ncbi:MAG: magnesium transporter [Chloroflexota bacterium]|jgi:Mg2+ and Co2+ transporter CorA|nr:magnesium transporter [Chloroflexota bacterium]
MAKGSQRVVTKARLFDADRTDKEIELGSKTVASIGDRQLLWVDAVVTDDPADGHAVLTWLPFDADIVERMWASSPAPRLAVHGDFFLARVVVLRERKGRDERVLLDLAVGGNVVLTAHREPLEFLAEIDDRIRDDTTMGELDSADFATVIIDGLVTSYLELTDAILMEVDRLDGEALKLSSGRDLLTDLVAVRRRIAAVRRVLVAHRTVFASMAGADFRVITGPDSAPQFDAVTERYNGAIDAIDSAREALIGTFDIYMSRTAQRTNDTVKILTIVSILLLPTGVIAGFMGMNIKAPYSNDDPTIFWFVVVGIVLVAAVTVVALRVRRWL